MRPLDPRLLRQARAARVWVLSSTVLGVAATGLIVTQALLLARVISGVAMHGESLADHRTAVAALVAIVAARALLSATQERFGHRAATAVVRQLRAKVVEHALARVGAADGDGGLPGAELAALVTRGLDQLDGYLTRYLPQLLLSATLTPAVLAVIWWQDWISGLIVLLTLPLIPLFMALVGMAGQAAADRGLSRLLALGAQVLDLIAGLPTLQAHGRTGTAVARIRVVADAYRRATMRTLRAAFLSALVLELLTSLSVALVAVSIGLRLVSGHLHLSTGLAVLLLAPEVYLPLRQVGAQFHASLDGLAAAGRALDFLDQPVPATGAMPAPDLSRCTIRLSGLRIVHAGMRRATPRQLDAELRPGEVVALTGPSGCGKSSVVAALLGLISPTAGRIAVIPCGARGEELSAEMGRQFDLHDLDPNSWWRQLTWVPQHPAVVPGTLAENVLLFAPGASAPDLEAAAQVTGLADVVAAAPDGWATWVGQGGLGLSAGQRQRLALTRALLHPAPLVVLDEPTAHLDAAAERGLIAGIENLRRAGRTVLLVAHRPALIALADRAIAVRSGPLDVEPTQGGQAAPQMGPTGQHQDRIDRAEVPKESGMPA